MTQTMRQHILAGQVDAIAFDHFRSGLLALFSESEDPQAQRHVPGYTRLILEVARKSEEEDAAHPDVKAFARYFTDKAPAFSQTRAGRSALLFEAWLMERGADLFGKFLETVLVDETNYLATFTDRLNERDLELLKQGTKDICSFDVAVRAGDRDNARGIISDVTILQCKAQGSLSLKLRKDGTLEEPRANDAPRADRLQRPTVKESRVRRLADVLSEELPVARLYEVNEAGAARSKYGAWAVYEAPLSTGGSETVVTFCDDAFVLPQDLVELCDGVERFAQLYEGLPAEFDLLVEHALRELCEEEGWPVRNPEHARGVLGESLIALRDDMLVDEYPVLFEAAADDEDEEEEEEESDEDDEDDEDDDEEEPESDPDAEFEPEPEPEPTDHMDEPEFYRDDLQGYYDMLLTIGVEGGAAKQRIRDRFKVTGLVITPSGEVRAPGIVDRPKSPGAAPLPPPPPAGAKDEPEAEEEPEPSEKAAQAAEGRLSGEEEGEVRAWVESAPREAPSWPPLLRAWARLARVSEARVRESWDAVTAPLRPEDEPALWRVAAERVKRSLPLRESVAGEERLRNRYGVLGVETLDDAFGVWVVHEDGDLDDFEDWVRVVCPHLADALEAWQPLDEPLHESRREDSELIRLLVAGGASTTNLPRMKRGMRPRQRESISEAERALYDKWRRLINVPSSKLREFQRGTTFRAALGEAEELRLAKRSLVHTLRMRATPVESWTGTDWQWAGRQVKFVERLRRTGAPLIEHGELTRKYVALRAWGHDPSVTAAMSEREVTQLLLTSPALAHRAIDALPGSPPHFVGDLQEYDAGRSPDFKVLKKHRTKLTPEERAEVMASKAVWHMSDQNGPTPAVWKSVVGDKVWFVTNTHRAFNATPTLKGAIGRFHKFIKSTA